MADESIYDEMKNHPAVKKLIDYCGNCTGHDFYLVMEKIKKIQKLIDDGKTYNIIYEEAIFLDKSSPSLALILHIEASNAKNISNYMELKDYISAENEELEYLFCQAQEYIYDLVLSKILRDGGKYNDLLAINPKDYRLPEMWGNDNMDKSKMIQRAIFFHIKRIQDEMDPFGRKSLDLNEISNSLNASIDIINQAVNYYSKK